MERNILDHFGTFFPIFRVFRWHPKHLCKKFVHRSDVALVEVVRKDRPPVRSVGPLATSKSWNPTCIELLHGIFLDMIHVLGIPWTLKPSKGSNIVFKTLYSSKTHQVWRIDAMQTISNHICCCVSAVFSPQIFVSHWWKLWRHNAPHDEWRLPTSGRCRDVETDDFFWCFVCFVYAFTAVQCQLFESMCLGVSGSVRSRLNFKKQSRKNREVFQLYFCFQNCVLFHRSHQKSQLCPVELIRPWIFCVSFFLVSD